MIVLRAGVVIRKGDMLYVEGAEVFPTTHNTGRNVAPVVISDRDFSKGDQLALDEDGNIITALMEDE